MSSSTVEGFDSSEADMLLIKVMSPVFGFPRDLTFRMLATSTIKDVKDKITGSLDSRPPCDQQRLIYRGKMMQDDSRLETVLGLNSGLVGSDPKEAFTFHLMLRPSSSPAPTPVSTSTPIVQNALPNTSTFHTRSIFSEQVPEESAAHAALGELTRSGLQRLEGFQRQLRQRQEFLNSRSGPDRASSSGVSLPGASSSSGLAQGPGADATMTPTRTIPAAADTSDGESSSQGRAGLRHAYEQLRERDLGDEDTTTIAAFSDPSLAPGQLPVFHLPANNPHAITSANPVYLLQDASGRPRALLLGPPRSANPTLADILGGLRGPLGQPGVGIPDLRGLGLPPLPDLANLGAMGGIAGNNLLGAGLGLGDHFGGAHAHHRVGFHGAVLERPRQARHFNLPDLIRGVRARASHFWLAIRLAVFVVLFTGSGGWRRMLYLGSIAVVIFIWETGILEPFLRPVIDAINPPPPPAPAPAPAQTPAPTPAAADNPTNTNPPPPSPPPAPPAPGQNPNRNLDPAQTAQMLIDRQQDRFRDIFRSIERCVMIFLASLIPGLHERHVNAVEQRQRDEAMRQQQQQLAAAGGGGVGEGEGAGQQPPPAPQPEPQIDEVEVEPLVVL
ncbi:hypothetical protein L873DRAFT_1730546 [Choiromyces venosus 120613-1]|uniref:Ubiquitin-like domain-containing protein n=1 Tax=Choiromyces venosus 120613-1 TaxID=1336337 RepID=A0A3N4K5D9_9PEZI|nr:hypothetical protein L873DRAFT_1730546 [Choiromyces venosus 120613-1]